MLMLGGLRAAGYTNMILSALNFGASLFLANYYLSHGAFLFLGNQFYIDALNLLLIVLTTFVIFTTAIFSNTYMWHNVTSGKILPKRLRLYHIMYQLFALTMLIALMANNLGLLWVAMEGATLATVFLVSLYRTKEAIEAAWKYFILCIVGIALALFGTVLIYFAASQLEVTIKLGIFWTELHKYAANLDPKIIKIAFVFLLIGYGTKIGLVPLHNWLPDAHSESPAPMSTLLSGLLLNVALYALVRFKILVDATLNNNFAGNMMIVFGLLSFFVAVIFMQRQQNIKRLFSYSSIEHMGLMTFAFGLNNPLANFCALFYMLMHSLTKTAIFVTVGNVIQVTGTQTLDKMRGLINSRAFLGWSLLIATLIIAGIPPFGIFTSELLLVLACYQTLPILAIILAIGLVLALAGLLKHIQPVVYGEKTKISESPVCMFPAVFHLGLVLVFGLYLPGVVQKILQQAVIIIQK